MSRVLGRRRRPSLTKPYNVTGAWGLNLHMSKHLRTILEQSWGHLGAILEPFRAIWKPSWTQAHNMPIAFNALP
eukprot:7853392-Karenia_brevis.AAC.1